jgi:hypothetical protein
VTSYYNIYGYVIAVEGKVDALFAKEFQYFKANNVSKIDLRIKVNSAGRELPTRPFIGSSAGIYLPFSMDEDTLYYDENLPSLDIVLAYAQGFLWWPDKTILHAGAVEKNDKAFVFSGTGNVGKTSIVLNLINTGDFNYLADDWLIIDKEKAYPFPKLIHIFDYNLKNKEIAKKMFGRKSIYYRILFNLIDLCWKYAPHRYFRFILDAFKPKFSVPFTKFSSNFRLGTTSKVNKLFFLERGNVDRIVIKNDITPEEFARRLSYVNMHEWNFFFNEYYRYVSQYNAESQIIEKRFKHDYEIMLNLSRNAELYRMVIPKGIDITRIDLMSIPELGLKED